MRLFARFVWLQADQLTVGWFEAGLVFVCLCVCLFVCVFDCVVV